MKILQIEVSNYRLIKALLLDLNGENLAVAGKTGQGKTTAISLLWEALKMVGDPVTHGEKKGQIRITLGDGETEVFITRSFTAKTAPITIVTSKGKNISASAFADWFCGLGQNPHKIMEMKPKEQAQALLEAVKLPEGVDLGELEVKRAQAASERLDLKRDGERDARALGVEPEKAERVDLSELLQQQNDASEANFERTKIIGDISNAESTLEILKAAATQKANELNQLEQAAKQAANAVDDQIESINQMQSTLTTLAPAVDMADVQKSIQDGTIANTKADQWEAWEKQNQALIKLREEYKAKDNQVKELDQAKKDALAAAEWPLEGLSVEDGTIIFNGSPLQQCGNSEQMLVCGALAAETISQHKLHVVRMDGIESMDPEDFKKLSKIFNDKGIQVLSSRVTRGDVDDGELLIVDGELQEGEPS